MDPVGTIACYRDRRGSRLHDAEFRREYFAEEAGRAAAVSWDDVRCAKRHHGAAARRRARRPKVPKLAQRCGLRRLVAAKLALRWSPQQIVRWLPGAHPDEPEWRVSHETIHLSLFMQPRGTPRKQLTRYLRTRRKVADRAVPGHWEGDLLLGRGNSGIATRVERTTRFAILIRLPRGRSSAAVLDALAARIRTLPPSQSWSMSSSGISVAPGKTVGLASSQSVPPVAMESKPSPSPSKGNGPWNSNAPISGGPTRGWPR